MWAIHKEPLIDIERRRPVWSALAEFYLDIELSDEELRSTKAIFLASGYSMEEIRRMERDEVRPVVGVNLFSAAGIWSGFDEQWLEKRILRRIARGRPWFQRLFLRNWMTDDYWRRMAKL